MKVELEIPDSLVQAIAAAVAEKMGVTRLPEALSAREAAGVLGMGLSSFRSAVERGEIKRIPGTARLRVARREVERLLAGEEVAR
jgi:hypothetical protein